MCTVRCILATGVSNGARTRDLLDHNQALCQLSYTHQDRDPRGDPREATVREYYIRDANSSTTAAETACTSAVVGPGSAMNAALR